VSVYKYTKSHEYIMEDGGVYRVGLSAYAADSLGDITFVEMPEPGAKFAQGAAFANVESVKAVSEIYAPVDMEIVEINAVLADAPETVNASAMEAGWLVKVKVSNPAQLSGLMSQADYDVMDKEGH
jgi:glycine cleavage system H protein